MSKTKRKIKTIKIDADKCNGCRACEIACSGFHSTPKYDIINPARSRIQVITHRLKNIWLPVFAGEYTPAECMGRDIYVIDGKEYGECAFCRQPCPSRDLFKEPDSKLPLKCDMCEDDPPQKEPLCVQVCLNNVLVYEEREVEEDDVFKSDMMEMSIKSVVDSYGLDNVVATLARMSEKS
ncbi:hypothetical protein SPSYN_01028 [Sporotomaculum syntrophicum]|uniref:4Fe-4S ferredoxin-type domain-containing protein n=1 Tax=Sporotomaculum syntrophicum TaxID=182264 RepID=A0A9D2WRK5_9FIRM|nr:(4Fe-4S)-binding protein [Sporotomaculum syntrophicum]KAF1086280.1 hypothetical protein SPSYN_01028 [Sporotomaculum syntrophicum]